MMRRIMAVAATAGLCGALAGCGGGGGGSGDNRTPEEIRFDDFASEFEQMDAAYGSLLPSSSAIPVGTASYAGVMSLRTGDPNGEFGMTQFYGDASLGVSYATGALSVSATNFVSDGGLAYGGTIGGSGGFTNANSSVGAVSIAGSLNAGPGGAVINNLPMTVAITGPGRSVAYGEGSRTQPSGYVEEAAMWLTQVPPP